jgi:hypothetical protein
LVWLRERISTHNPKVGGSNPPPATKELIENKQIKREPDGYFGLMRATVLSSETVDKYVREMLDALKADYELRGKLTPQFSSHLVRVRDSRQDSNLRPLTAALNCSGKATRWLSNGNTCTPCRRFGGLMKAITSAAVFLKNLNFAAS